MMNFWDDTKEKISWIHHAFLDFDRSGSIRLGKKDFQIYNLFLLRSLVCVVFPASGNRGRKNEFWEILSYTSIHLQIGDKLYLELPLMALIRAFPPPLLDNDLVSIGGKEFNRLKYHFGYCLMNPLLIPEDYENSVHVKFPFLNVARFKYKYRLFIALEGELMRRIV